MKRLKWQLPALALATSTFIANIQLAPAAAQAVITILARL